MNVFINPSESIRVLKIICAIQSAVFIFKFFIDRVINVAHLITFAFQKLIVQNYPCEMPLSNACKQEKPLIIVKGFIDQVRLFAVIFLHENGRTSFSFEEWLSGDKIKSMVF